MSSVIGCHPDLATDDLSIKSARRKGASVFEKVACKVLEAVPSAKNAKWHGVKPKNLEFSLWDTESSRIFEGCIWNIVSCKLSIASKFMLRFK